MFTFFANVNSSNFTVAVKPMIAEYHISSTRAGFLVCFNVLLFGIGGVIWVPLMRVIGKRPVFLLTMLLVCVFNIWSLCAQSFNSLLASRILSGFAAASADATVPGVVSDLVLAQDRGHYMMIFHLALCSGTFIGPLINGYLVQEQNWRWMCGFMAIGVGATFLCGIFTIRETSYLKPREPLDQNATIEQPKTQLQWMSLTSGYNKNASFFKTIRDIILMAGYPPILWVGATVGVTVGW